jgi:hypothetical protein
MGVAKDGIGREQHNCLCGVDYTLLLNSSRHRLSLFRKSLGPFHDILACIYFLADPPA